MRKPRSSRDAALLGVLSGLSPLHSCGVFLLDALYVAALGGFVGLLVALTMNAGCAPDPVWVGRGVPAEPRILRPFDHQTTRPQDPPTEMDPSLLSYGFLWALSGVESGHNDAAYNPAEGAVGRFQIRQCYLDDANAALGKHYSLSEMSDGRKAMEVVCAYLGRYAPAFEARAGRPATVEDLARIHNGGPRGAEKDATLDYARRFRKAYAGVAWYTDCPRFEVAAR